MGKRSKLNLMDVLRIMRHLADVAALRDDPNAQRQLLIDGLNQIVGTNQGFFYVADGWTPQETPRWAHQTLSRDVDPVVLKYMAEFGVKYPLSADPYGEASIRNPAALQTMTKLDVLPDLDARRAFPHFMEIYDAGRVSDGVVSLHRVKDEPSRIVGVGMHNFRNTGELNPRQVAMVELAVKEIHNLVERGHLQLPASSKEQKLPPRLQQILDRLLAGESPKHIAHHLGISVHTVREHIQRLYIKMSVTTREELMAKYVR